MATTLASQVQELYVGYLGRAADKAGLDFWVKAIESGTSTLESVALGFTLSEEYKAQYNGLTTTQLVAKVYQNVLGRAADADGLAFWAGEVNKGVIKADTLVKTMISSLGAIDQLTIDNKVAAANAYTIAAGDKYSVEAGKAAVTGASVGTVPGVQNPSQTFTLTTGNDFADVAGSFRNASTTPFDFKFTTGNEVVNATTTTMGNAGANSDSLADGSTADADVLNVSVTGNTTMATIANIETINFNVVAGTAASTVANLVGVTGLKTITLSGSPAGAIDLTNGGAYTSIGATGVTTIDASKMTTGGISVSSAGAATTAALTITGSDAADTITGGLGADTINGGAGADTLAGGAGEDTINGGAGNDFIQGGNDADTLNGDAGNDNIDGGLGADIINGGAGNDIIVTTAGNDTVTGGAGNDFIALGAVAGGLAAADTTAVIAQLGTAGDAAIFLAGTKATTAAGNNTLHLEASLADNGADVVTGFTIGATDAATGGDILNVSKFLGKAVTNYVEIGSADGANNVTGSNVVVVTDGTLATALAEAGGAGVTFGANAKTVVVEFQETTTALADDNAVVRYVTTDSNGAILTNDVVVTLVGVTAEATNSIAGFVAANFA